jgi:hypothetical protein
MSDFSVLDADMQRDLNRDGLRKLWQALMDGRIESAAKVYARDAILLLPQDGGRIEGRAQIAAGGLMQPGERFVKLGRIVGDGGVWISECDVCRRSATEVADKYSRNARRRDLARNAIPRPRCSRMARQLRQSRLG